MKTREQLLVELADVQQRLIDTPVDDLPRRFELRAEQHRLRNEIRDIGSGPDPDEHRSTEELEAEARALRYQIDAIADRDNVDMVMQAGGSGDGWFGAHAHFAAINSRISSATERAELEARLARVEGVLADRQIAR